MKTNKIYLEVFMNNNKYGEYNVIPNFGLAPFNPISAAIAYGNIGIALMSLMNFLKSKASAHPIDQITTQDQEMLGSEQNTPLPQHQYIAIGCSYDEMISCLKGNSSDDHNFGC
jgi:hypothetical protein